MRKIPIIAMILPLAIAAAEADVKVEDFFGPEYSCVHHVDMAGYETLFNATTEAGKKKITDPRKEDSYVETRKEVFNWLRLSGIPRIREFGIAQRNLEVNGSKMIITRFRALTTAAASHDLLTVLASENPADIDWIAALPQDVTFAVSGTISMRKLWDAVMPIYSKMGSILFLMERLQANIGQDELLDSIEGRFGFALNIVNVSGEFPHVKLLISLPDRNGTLHNMMKSCGLQSISGTGDTLLNSEGNYIVRLSPGRVDIYSEIVSVGSAFEYYTGTKSRLGDSSDFKAMRNTIGDSGNLAIWVARNTLSSNFESKDRCNPAPGMNAPVLAVAYLSDTHCDFTLISGIGPQFITWVTLALSPNMEFEF
ncbi:MAG: hypothetical protein AB7F40_06205 [Victivallaceae bacterium]|nr:hypothetical protein [Victivallaceae bacterium]